MLALIDAKIENRPSFAGRVKRIFGHRKVDVAFERVLGSTVLRMTLCLTEDAPADAELAFVRMLLAHYGIRNVCFSIDFPYKEQVCTGGVREINDNILSAKLAGEIACTGAKKHDTAAIFAGRLTRESERALRLVCRKFRYVLAPGQGINRISAALREESGVSIVQNPTGKMLYSADAALFFTPPERKVMFCENCLVVPTGEQSIAGVGYVIKAGPVELSIPEQLKIPEGFSPNALLSTALTDGRINESEIQLKSVTIMHRGHSEYLTKISV